MEKLKVGECVKYTAEQQKIITTQDPCVEVLACPGSGKTAVLLARISYLINSGLSPDKILVLSFSNSTVDLIKDKLIDTSVHVKTFHSFGATIVQDNYKQLGFKRRPKLLSPMQQRETMAEVLTEKPKSHKAIKTAFKEFQDIEFDIIHLIEVNARAQGDYRAVSELAQMDQKFLPYAQHPDAVKNIFIGYRKLKKQGGFIDYADMVKLAKKVLEPAASQYDHVLVDECQDMSDNQAELLQGLATIIPNVMTFGDPNQAIYGFMGGKYRPDILSNRRLFHLTKSFRLTYPIAELATSLFNTSTKKPIKGRGPGNLPQLFDCANVQARSKILVSIISNLTFEQSEVGIQPSIAVLARTKAQLRDIESVLLFEDFMVEAKYRLPQPEHVERVMALLKMIDQLADLTPTTKAEKVKLEQRILKVTKSEDENFNPRTLANCRRLIKSGQVTPSLEGRYILARKIYEKLLRASENPSLKDIRSELGRWEPIARKFDEVLAFKKHIRELQKKSPIITSTIHGAKGREWDYVLVLGVTDGSIPHYSATKLKDKFMVNLLEEERRLFYVAVTRPKKGLFIFHEPIHHAPSSTVYTKPSRFMTQEVMDLFEHS